jgi:hypothetical protein
MWNRPNASLLAAGVLCLGLGACIFEAENDLSPLFAGDEPGAPPTFSIGGTIGGASGSVVLQNSNGTLLIVARDGSFTFDTPMVPSALYNVTVVVPPNFQICRVAKGAGTVGFANIHDIAVTCTPNIYSAVNSVARKDQRLPARELR